MNMETLLLHLLLLLAYVARREKGSEEIKRRISERSEQLGSEKKVL